MLAYESNETENVRGNENDNERKLKNEKKSEEKDDCMMKFRKSIEKINLEQNVSDIIRL